MSARSISNLSITISANTAQASAALDALMGKARQTKSGIDRASGLVGGAFGRLLGGRIGGFGGLVGGLFGGPVGAVAGGLVGTGIDKSISAITTAFGTGLPLIANAVKEMVMLGAEYEMAIAVFGNAMGSKSAGIKIVGEIENLAAATIFSSQALTEQARRLLGAGIAADNVVPSLTKLALLAQKAGIGEEGLARLALAFGQIKQAGVLRGQELIQLNQAGVGTEQLANALGMTSAQFVSMKEQGQISYGMIAKAANNLGKEAQKEADVIAKTFTGRLNAVRDVGLRVFKQIGLSIIEGFGLTGAIGQVGAYLESLPEKFNALKPVMEKLAVYLKPFADAIYSIFIVSMEVNKSFFKGFMPSLADAKKIAEDIAVAFGGLIDMSLTFGQVLLTALVPVAQVLDRIVRLLQGNDFDSLTNLTLNALSGVTLAKSEVGEGGFQERARQLFKQGLPKMPEMKTKFDQRGFDPGKDTVPAAARELAQKIKEGFAEGKIGGPVRDFQTKMENLRIGEAAGLYKDMRGATDQFILNEFKSLTGAFKQTAAELPRAIDMNTVAGQEQFEKVINNLRSQNQDVPGLLRNILRQNEQQVRHGENTVNELRKLFDKAPVRVGGF